MGRKPKIVAPSSDLSQELGWNHAQGADKLGGCQMESISWTSNSGWTKYEKIMDQNFEGKRSSFFHLVETLLIFSLYFSEYLGITFHFQTLFSEYYSMGGPWPRSDWPGSRRSPWNITNQKMSLIWATSQIDHNMINMLWRVFWVLIKSNSFTKLFN